MNMTGKNNTVDMSKDTKAILDRRNIKNSNANLLKVLKAGQSVLDVGCGTGNITRDVCNFVGHSGFVKGIDTSANMIELAKNNFEDVLGLCFEQCDILDLEDDNGFDLITLTRTLQWISEYELTLKKIEKLLKPEGVLCILDYNHELISFTPEVPASMQYFYKQFLSWRSGKGMNNRIGSEVVKLLENSDLQVIDCFEEFEISKRGDSEFDSKIIVWGKVAETHGVTMVKEGCVSEEERKLAVEEYYQWCASEALQMKLHLIATHAEKMLR